MRLLFVGDVVGRSGRAIVVERLPRLIADWKLDFVVVNGENAAGVWGIREPLAQAPAVDPDIVLTPLLAFDRARHRLGYGGGYYDLTIAQLRGRKTIVAVGLAFAVQEVFTVPVTPRDAPLDLVLTEREVIDFRDG